MSDQSTPDQTTSSGERTTSVIVAGARTPMGRLLGSLSGFSGADLGGVAIAGALDKAGVAPDQVDYVIMGQVLTAGAGQIPARQAAAKAGIPMTVPALTINKVCLSGLDAIALADQLIRAGEFEIVVAGGQESMTNAPHLLEKSRSGFKYGDVTMRDHMAFDGLWDAFTDQAMGALTEAANAGDGALTREEPMRLNLGCCDRLLPGYVNVDLVEGPGVEVADLREPWPWPDSSVEQVRAWDIIEHLPDKIRTMNELWRVLAPGGTAEIAVPTTDGTGAFGVAAAEVDAGSTPILPPPAFASAALGSAFMILARAQSMESAIG